jgi:hypothetical protein
LLDLTALTAGCPDPILIATNSVVIEERAMQEDKTEWIDGPTKIAAVNDNNAEQRCVLAIARLIGRRIAREEFEKRIAAANDNAPVEKRESD